MKTEKEKMLSGEEHISTGKELEEERIKAKTLCWQHNTTPNDRDPEVLNQLFGYQTDAYIEAPFFCDYGYNISLGSHFYSNHNLVILDCAPVTIGHHVFIGPNVVITTVGHSMQPERRNQGYETALPITIGNSVWIGASVTILPGITIGDDVVIGAGSVVTKDIPSGSVAYGNPCRVQKSIY